LQAVHALTHPTAKLARGAPGAPVTAHGAEVEVAHPPLAKTTASAEELFSRLAAEDEETEEDGDCTARSGCGR
ncbi:MAG: hypothetical protein JXP72_03385, partial [Coriobacteriia bacterium]|nr:hypothetical protein [Coriobacteriia bacterium]